MLPKTSEWKGAARFGTTRLVSSLSHCHLVTLSFNANNDSLLALTPRRGHVEGMADPTRLIVIYSTISSLKSNSLDEQTVALIFIP